MGGWCVGGRMVIVGFFLVGADHRGVGLAGGEGRGDSREGLKKKKGGRGR